MSQDMVQEWKARAANLKAETYALYFACRNLAVPWYTKLLIACVVAYAVSPIDLIPDFIPILGFVDDLLIVPFGIALKESHRVGDANTAANFRSDLFYQ
jgi:uncharacterized membrane protein YkvA (DUF1232 family)